MISNGRMGSSPISSTRTLVNHLIFKGFLILKTRFCQPFANRFFKVLFFN